MYKFDPEQTVKCCNNIERGVRFDRYGVGACCCSTKVSPLIISPEEMASGKVDYDLILERRHELLECVNGLNDKWDVSYCLNCDLLIEKKYKDVDLTSLGGQNLCSGFNIAHFSSCNLKCTYCPYSTFDKETNNEYSNIIEFIEEFRKRGKLIKRTTVDFNGGEPTLLKDFDKILDYLIDNQIGEPLIVYSNCVKYSPRIYEALRKNQIWLVTSPDAALPSTSKTVKQIDTYRRIWDTIVRYRNSGTKGLIVKYVITDDNRTDDDMYAFIHAAAALGPNVAIGICPAYPYDDMEIPHESVEFGAKLYYNLEKYTGRPPRMYSDYSRGDVKFLNYSRELRELVAQMKKEKPISYIYNLNRTTPCGCAKKPPFWEFINLRTLSYKIQRIFRLIECMIKNK